MLEYATFSVISPEGCASILWKTAEKAAEAAEALGITSDRLKKLGLIDEIIPEPLGGAHRDVVAACQYVSGALSKQLTQLQQQSVKELLSERMHKLLAYGKFSGK